MTLKLLPEKTGYAVLVQAFRPFLLIVLGLAWSALAQSVTLPLWPKGVPEVTGATVPERETSQQGDHLVAGRGILTVTDVTQPSLSVYPPSGGNTGAAVVVFPGGGYNILAYDLEGTEVCTWLNSIGVTCVLVKYRVPIHGRYLERLEDLEDAQRAMRMTRQHAAAWKIDPHRIGVLGFSAGGHLAAVLSVHPGQPTYKPQDDADPLDARPDFVVLIYPAYLVQDTDLDHLAPGILPDAATPPTFLVQAEDDPVHEENALFYFQALKQAKVSAELHIFAQGGHGYGLRPTELPVTHWPAMAATWMHTIGVLSK